MAVPSDPTVTTIITDAFRHCGIPNPQAAQVAEFAAGGFQTVKTALWAASARDRLLETSAMVLLPIGSGQVNTPSDFDHALSLDVYSTYEAMAFTMASSTSSTAVAPSTFSSDVSSIRGRYLFTTGGTGSGQYRQITAYDDTTKTLTITPTWTVTPDATTTAFIGTRQRRLVQDDPATWRVPSQGEPLHYRFVGSSSLNTDLPAIELSPVPDSDYYALILTYAPNLTRLDETGTLFVKHLRERRALWLAGLEYYVANRYDEARQTLKQPAWAMQLMQYQAHNPTYDRLEGAR